MSFKVQSMSWTMSRSGSFYKCQVVIGVWKRHNHTICAIPNSILITHSQSLDEESFQTFMVETEAKINSRPPLSPSNLLAMKSNVIPPPPGVFDSCEIYSQRRWRRIQHLLNKFWSRWHEVYLQTLPQRTKWQNKKRDVVLLN